jgi:hypothetical protein
MVLKLCDKFGKEALDGEKSTSTLLLGLAFWEIVSAAPEQIFLWSEVDQDVAFFVGFGRSTDRQRSQREYPCADRRREIQ